MVHIIDENINMYIPEITQIYPRKANGTAASKCTLISSTGISYEDTVLMMQAMVPPNSMIAKKQIYCRLTLIVL